MDERISEIKELLGQRRLMDAKSKISELEEDLNKLDNLQKFFDEVKNLIRNQGKSNMVSVDAVEKLVVDYGNK